MTSAHNWSRCLVFRCNDCVPRDCTIGHVEQVKKKTWVIGCATRWHTPGKLVGESFESRSGENFAFLPVSFPYFLNILHFAVETHLNQGLRDVSTCLKVVQDRTKLSRSQGF